jgi:hypothetical protein
MSTKEIKYFLLYLFYESIFLQTLQELKWGESELKPNAKLACFLPPLLGFHAIDAEVHAGFQNLETGLMMLWNSACSNSESLYSFISL